MLFTLYLGWSGAHNIIVRNNLNIVSNLESTKIQKMKIISNQKNSYLSSILLRLIYRNFFLLVQGS